MIQKAWWKSRVLWINALVLLGSTAELKLDLLKDVTPAEVYAAVAIVLPVINMVLRVITTLPLGKRDSEFIR